MRVLFKNLSKWGIAFCLGLGSLSGGAQIRIQPGGGVDVPKEEINQIFKATCRVIAEEFRLGDPSEVEVPITLVLDQLRDGVVGDETSQVFTIYMSRWDETMFATAVSRIALQHLLSRERKARIVRESLRRAHRVAPVSAGELAASGDRQSRPVGGRSRIRFPRSSLPSAPACLSDSPSLFSDGDGRVLERSGPVCQPANRLAP